MMEQDVKKRMLKIGIIAEKSSKVFWWAKTKQQLEKMNADIVYFVEVPSNRYKREIGLMPAKLLWRIIDFVESFGQHVVPQVYNPTNAIELECFFKGHFKDFSGQALNIIAEQKVDMLVRLGGRGIYRGKFLKCTPLGVLSIHHGDNRTFRGGPPGFWEILQGEPHVGFVVQRLTPLLDGGAIYARGFVNTAATMAATRAAIFKAADEALADTISNLQGQKNLEFEKTNIQSLGKIYKMPSILKILAYVFRCMGGKTR